MSFRNRAPARIVVDTGPLIALGDEDDDYHEACLAWFEQERAQLLLPVPVITEVGYALGNVGGPKLEAAFLSGLSRDRRFRLCSPGRRDLLRMSEIMTKYAGFNLGTADVSVVAIAEHADTTTIATVDRRDFTSIVPANGTHFDLVPDPLQKNRRAGRS